MILWRAIEIEKGNKSVTLKLKLNTPDKVRKIVIMDSRGRETVFAPIDGRMTVAEVRKILNLPPEE